LIETLSKGKKIQLSKLDELSPLQQDKIENNLKYKKVTVLYSEMNDKEPLLGNNGKIYYYKYWGLVVVRSERMFMSFIVGNSNIKHNLGHMHNDALSIELMVDDKYITRDPGTYVYTASPSLRNKFRSTMAHNTVHVDDCEQNEFNGTFGMVKRSRHNLIYCSEKMIIAKVRYGDIEHIRRIEIDNHSIKVIDYCNMQFSVGFNNKMISTGYGKIRNL
jgi:hypothetical protein